MELFSIRIQRTFQLVSTPMGVIGFAYKYVIAEKFSMFSCIGYQRFFIR